MSLRVSVLFFLILIVFMTGCASTSGTITAEINDPAAWNIKLIHAGKQRVIFESTIPCEFLLEKGPTTAKYYVVLTHEEQDPMYGILEFVNATRTASLANVAIDINDSVIKKVMDNQVSTITVKDHAEHAVVLRLDLGNRMPPDMESAVATAERRATGGSLGNDTSTDFDDWPSD